MSGCRSRPRRRSRSASRSTRSAISANIWPRAPASIVQVDVARIGGITPWLKVAHAAEAFDMPVCPHFLMELHVSLACAVPNGKYVEYIPQLDDLTTSRLRIENGMARRAGDAGHRRRLGLRRGEGEAIAEVDPEIIVEGERDEAHGHGDRRQAGADRRIQAHSRRGLAGDPGQDLGLQHHATIRFSCASRRTCCSAIGNITATIGPTDAAKMAADPRTQEWWAVPCRCRQPLAIAQGGRMVGDGGRSLSPRLTRRQIERNPPRMP